MQPGNYEWNNKKNHEHNYLSPKYVYFPAMKVNLTFIHDSLAALIRYP